MIIELEIINKITVVIINLGAIFLGTWVLFADIKARLNKRFFLMIITGLLWVNCAYFAFSSQDLSMALFWYRCNAISAILTILIFYYVCISAFPGEKIRRALLDNIFFLIFFILIILTAFTDIILKGTEMGEFGMELIYGKFGEFLYYIPPFIFLFIICIQLIKKYFILEQKDKLKIQYFLIGIILWFLFNAIFNVLTPLLFKTVQYQHLGDYSIIFLLGFTAFAVVRRQLFGIKVVLTALLVALIAILLLLNTLLFTESIPFQILKGVIFIIFLFFGYYLIKSVQTEIKQKEKLAEAYLKLEKLDKAKTEFLSIASHQLRTPLTAVKGYISMMIEGIYDKPSEKMAKPLKNIYESNERLIKLVNSLLNISRIETGRVEMNIKELSVEEVVNGTIKELNQTAKDKNIYLKLEKIKEPLPKISADEEKIRQVIMNVIDNAIKYTEKGGITINLKTIGQNLQIVISDTGEGMTREEIANLFISFTRGKAGTKLWTEGAGLGLYIAKKFVEMHNGRVWAESPGKGKGSVFYIELPTKSTEEKLMEKL